MKVCKRAGGKRDSWKQRFTLGAMFTHHQKTIVMDVDPARWSGQANRPLKSQGEAVKAAQAVCAGQNSRLVTCDIHGLSPLAQDGRL